MSLYKEMGDDKDITEMLLRREIEDDTVTTENLILFNLAVCNPCATQKTYGFAATPDDTNMCKLINYYVK